MKTLKITTLITGILVALISLNVNAEGMTGGESAVAEKQMILDEMNLTKAFEIDLIEEYLDEQIELTSEIKIENMVKIYDENDELIYEGDQFTEEAVLLTMSADYLMKLDNVSYYRIHD